MPKKNKEKSVYAKYREILERPKLSKEEIDQMRVNVKLLALSLVEYVLKTKIHKIY